MKIDSDKCVFFCGACKNASPSKGYANLHKGCLSQWQECSFVVDGVSYSSAEQFMMAEKARTFGDVDTLEKILAAKLPRKIKALGREVKGFDGKKWDSVKSDVVVRGNMAKFSQNRELLSFLLGTGDAMLVEASPEDCIWGVGLKESDRDILDPDKWKGENLLGRALMEVRAKLADTKEAEEIKALSNTQFKEGQRAATDIVALRMYYAQREARRPLTSKSVKKVTNQPVKKVGTTHWSLVMGLGTPNSKKWQLFLKGGPYWNYLVGFILSKPYFASHRDLVDDAVNLAISKVARFMGTGSFVYKEEGKGYFRSFLKTVTLRTAFDLLKKELRHEALHEDQARDEQGDMQAINAKVNKSGERKKAGVRQVPDDIWDDLDKDTAAITKELNAYDKSVIEDAGGGSAAQEKRKKTPMKGHLLSLDDISPDDDESESDLPDRVAMYNWKKISSEKELRALQQMQANVLYIALGHVLDDEKVSVKRRLILRLLYVDMLTLEQVRGIEEFAALPRDAFDKRVFDAREELRKKVRALWRLVMPDGEGASEREVCMLWAALSNTATNWKMLKVLQKRAAEMVGRIALGAAQ